MKNLLEVPINKKVQIVKIEGGAGVHRQLSQLGIGEGSEIILRRSHPLFGPLIVEKNGVRVAIGRGVAAKIFVEEL